MPRTRWCGGAVMGLILTEQDDRDCHDKFHAWYSQHNLGSCCDLPGARIDNSIQRPPILRALQPVFWLCTEILEKSSQI